MLLLLLFSLLIINVSASAWTDQTCGKGASDDNSTIVTTTWKTIATLPDLTQFVIYSTDVPSSAFSVQVMNVYGYPTGNIKIYSNGCANANYNVFAANYPLSVQVRCNVDNPPCPLVFSYTSVQCVPNCTGKICGPDGCHGTCGNNCVDNLNSVCENNGTLCHCYPNCVDRFCGTDGCNGTCGTPCMANQTCLYGGCVDIVIRTITQSKSHSQSRNANSNPNGANQSPSPVNPFFGQSETPSNTKTVLMAVFIPLSIVTVGVIGWNIYKHYYKKQPSNTVPLTHFP